MAIDVQPALSPHLVVDDAAAAIDFYVKAFGAEELGRVPRPDGKLIHAALRINGFTVLLNDDFPEMSGGKSRRRPSAPGPARRYRRRASCPTR
jgi:PhnB protein